MKVGIILDNLGNSQLAYLAIAHMNRLANIGFDDGVIFTKNITPACMPTLFACLNMCEAITYDGLLITTDIDSTIFSDNIHTSIKRVFYVWDLEWLRDKKDFLHNMKAFRDTNTKIVARSKSHAKLIENYCNRPVDAVIENFNLTEICNEFC